MEAFGSYLKEHREKKGIRLEEIASITKIHLRSLEFLEVGAWDRLPPEPFIRGFILAYAKYVGMDSSDILSRYQAERGEVKVAPLAGDEMNTTATAQEAEPTPAEVIENTGRRFDIRIGIGAVVAVVVVGLVSLIYLGKKKDTNYLEQVRLETEEPAAAPEPRSLAQQIAPAAKPVEPPTLVVQPTETAAKAAALAPEKKPEETTAAPATTAAVSATTASATTEIPAEEVKHEMVIEGKERTWTKVVVDESKPFEFFLAPGQKVNYKARDKIKIVLGNSTGTKVFHNGELTTGEKFQGTIHSFIFPKDAHFPQDKPKRDTATKAAEAKPEQASKENEKPATEE